MLNNLDLKKEEINFKDSGCRFSSSCLSCPIEICVYDNPSLVRNLEKSTRDNYIIIDRSEGLSNKQIADNIEPKVEEQHTAIKNEKVCDAILNNNGNQNDGNYINVVNKTLCLSSNHSFENGVGGTVNDGLDSSEDDTTNNCLLYTSPSPRDS